METQVHMSAGGMYTPTNGLRVHLTFCGLFLRVWERDTNGHIAVRLSALRASANPCKDCLAKSEEIRDLIA